MSVQETNLKAIADAIREKDGTADPIPAEDFPDRIRAIDTMPDDVRTITVEADPPEGGSVSGGGIASKGMVVTVEAESAYTHKFKGWRENGNSVNYDEQYTFPVENDRNLVAVFEPPASRLPEGYTELAYVDTSAGTGYQAVLFRYLTLAYSKHNRVISDMQAVALSSSNRAYFWCAYLNATIGSYDSHLNLVYESNTLKAQDYYSTSGKALTLFTGDVLNRRTIVDWDILTGDVLLDGENVGTVAKGTSASTRTNAISIPYQNNVNGGVTRIFGFKVFTDDVIVSDLVPAKNPDGVVGFYDVIQNKFFTHYGTNYPFIAGPEV